MIYLPPQSNYFIKICRMLSITKYDYVNVKWTHYIAPCPINYYKTTWFYDYLNFQKSSFLMASNLSIYFLRLKLQIHEFHRHRPSGMSRNFFCPLIRAFPLWIFLRGFVILPFTYWLYKIIIKQNKVSNFVKHAILFVQNLMMITQ